MIESKVSKPPVGKVNYFFKKEIEKEDKKSDSKRKNAGTNFNEYGYKLFTSLQRFFFYLSLIIIPISLFPLEWMMFEYGRVFVLIFFTIILLTFELIKFFIRGKVEIYKSPRDIVLSLLGISFLLSLIFSPDFLVSFWGYEYRLGTGFLSILAVFTYLFILKSIIKDFRALINLLLCLTLGIFLSAILSLLSFYGINPFGFLPEFEKFFFIGLPLFNSAKLSVGVWSVGSITSFFLFYYFFKIFSNDEAYLNKKLSLANAYRKKRAIQGFFLLIFLLIISIFVLAISVFSMKNLAWIGIVSLVGIASIFFSTSLLSGARILKYVTVLSLVIFFLLFVSIRLINVQKILNINPENLVEQVTLGNEAIWGITVSSLSESFSRALVGLGNDNFVIAYNLYRPAFSGDIDLNFVNYSYANNEIYNILANRGLIGLFIWLVVGFVIFKQFVQYLTDEEKKKMLKSDSLEHVAIITLDLLLIYIWVFAFFAYYSFILYFIFLLLLVLSSLFRNIAHKMYTESLVVHTNFFVEKIGQIKSDTLPKFFIIFVCVASVFCLYFILNDFTSRAYALKAEYILVDIEGDERYQKAIENYDEAILRNPNNYVFRRKVSLILMDYINKVLAKDFASLTDENERQEYIRIVGVYGEAAIEEAKKATDLAPMVGINWSNRDAIYADLVRMGFQNYMNTGIKVSEQTIMRNPNNYNPYINKATYLYLAGDTGGAISYIRQALEINPYNILALALAGEISLALQDYTNAKVYLENALNLLEVLDLTQMAIFNLYVQVQQNLEVIWSLEADAKIPEIEVEEFEIEEPDELTLPNN